MNAFAVTMRKAHDRMTFLLPADGMYRDLEYKVLNSNADKGFARCRHTLYNGKDKLTYSTAGTVSLAEIAPNADPESFEDMMRQLFGALSELAENGHLELRNVLFEPENIFVHSKTGKVSVVYVPAKNFESRLPDLLLGELYARILDYKRQNPKLSGETLAEFFVALAQKRGVKEIVETLGSIEPPPPPPPPPGEKEEFVLQGVGANKKDRFLLKKDQGFTIGKSKSMDGIIKNNNAVSKEHCRIFYRAADQTYCIEDLQSTNGTRVNGKKLGSGEAIPLSVGDKVKIANAEFVWKKAAKKGI